MLHKMHTGPCVMDRPLSGWHEVGGFPVHSLRCRTLTVYHWLRPGFHLLTAAGQWDPLRCRGYTLSPWGRCLMSAIAKRGLDSCFTLGGVSPAHRCIVIGAGDLCQMRLGSSLPPGTGLVSLRVPLACHLLPPETPAACNVSDPPSLLLRLYRQIRTGVSGASPQSPLSTPA